MKAVFVGGGAHRHLPILRGALAAGVFNNGEICLYDLNQSRAEAMGRMVQKTPEYQGTNCRIVWDKRLEEALDGADVVSIVLMAGSRLSHALSVEAELRHGFLGSDNVSLTGAFLALKGGPIIMDIARKMERYCPQASLIEFANPIAVLSGAVNNHTRIRAFGVCAGYSNHMADLTRVLFGKDEYLSDYDVEVAGINHFSFIVRGRFRGQDIHALMSKRLADPNWRVVTPSSYWPAAGRANIRNSVARMARIWREFGLIIFSTEGDGMKYLFFEEFYEQERRKHKPLNRRQIERQVNDIAAARQKADAEFRSLLDKDLNEHFWANYWQKKKNMDFARCDYDITVKLLKGFAGISAEKVVTSLPNKGAVKGFPERMILEYSQVLEAGQITPYGQLEVPPVVYGLIASLANHQTLLADAVATLDPRRLFEALFAYPVKQTSRAARSLWKELLAINKEEIPAEFQGLKNYI